MVFHCVQFSNRLGGETEAMLEDGLGQACHLNPVSGFELFIPDPAAFWVFSVRAPQDSAGRALTWPVPQPRVRGNTLTKARRRGIPGACSRRKTLWFTPRTSSISRGWMPFCLDMLTVSLSSGLSWGEGAGKDTHTHTHTLVRLT